MTTASSLRDYSKVNIPQHGTRDERAAALIDALWNVVGTQGVSWIGIYVGPGQRLADGRVAGKDEMLLGPCRNKPACSPIGLHGACGRSWRERASLVVRDVAALGANYVACDPKDRSEVVVPLFDEAGSCWGVLDADSFDLAAFDERDAHVLADLLARAGLTRGDAAPVVVIGQ